MLFGSRLSGRILIKGFAIRIALRVPCAGINFSFQGYNSAPALGKDLDSIPRGWNPVLKHLVPSALFTLSLGSFSSSLQTWTDIKAVSWLLINETSPSSWHGVLISILGLWPSAGGITCFFFAAVRVTTHGLLDLKSPAVRVPINIGSNPELLS